MRLFISYAHVDKPNVEHWLVAPLRTAGHDVWYDEELEGGQPWRQQLADQIAQSDAVIYAMTPEAVTSPHCKEEIDFAKRLGKPIVPVLMQDKTPVPPDLGSIQYVNFKDGATTAALSKLYRALSSIPAAAAQTAPTHTTTHTMTTPPASKTSNFVKIGGGILGILVSLATIFGVLPESARNSFFSAIGLGAPTTIATSAPTPATPAIIAQRDLDIRSGPGANFTRLNILPVGDALDVLAISEDRLWYLVLLRDGTTGWVLTAESGARLNGNPGVVRQITLTPTQTLTPSLTPTLTLTPSVTNTLTPTETPTPSYTPSETLTPTETLPPTFTLTPTNTLAVTATFTSAPTATEVERAFPCEAAVINPDGAATVINTYAEASSSASRGGATRVGNTVIVQRENVDSSQTIWYLIYDGTQRLGWITSRYLTLSETCPS